MERLAHVKAVVQQGIRQRRMLLQTILMYNAYRRRQLTVLLCLVDLLLLSRHQNNATERVYRRSCRRLIRNCGWWDLVWNSYSDERFKKRFRVSKNTFNFILSHIRHDLERKTVNKDPISPECPLGIIMLIPFGERRLLLYNSRFSRDVTVLSKYGRPPYLCPSKCKIIW